MDPVNPKSLDIHPDDPTLVFRKGRWTKRRKQSRYEEVDGKMHRLCTACDRMLPTDEFAIHGKTHRSQCKECKSPKDKIYREENHDQIDIMRCAYRAQHIDEKREYDKQYREQNKDQISIYLASYYRENEEHLKAYARQYVKENQDKIIAYNEKNHNRRLEKSKKWRAEKIASDPQFKLICRVRSRLASYLNYYRGKKSAPTLDLLGCGIEDLVRHLESQFVVGMSWENYGAWQRGQPMTWHIDHIRPCASFDLTDPDQQRACFHYTNLQPLWARDNMSKNDRLDWHPND